MMQSKRRDTTGREAGLLPSAFRLLMLMTVMQFRQVRVIVGERQVQMQMSMRFLK